MVRGMMLMTFYAIGTTAPRVGVLNDDMAASGVDNPLTAFGMVEYQIIRGCLF